MAQAGRPEKPVEHASKGELYRGSLIRELRQKKGLSREEMANLLGCHPDSLSKVETNGVNPSQHMIAKIAEVLAVPHKRLEQAPMHPRILRNKAASTSTVLRTPLAISHQKILMHRLSVAEKKLQATGKMVNELYEEIREIGALVADLQNEE